MASVSGTLLGLVFGMLGLVLLHRAWRRRGGALLTLAGWLALVLAVPAWRASGAAWDKAVAFAAVVPSLAVVALLLREMDVGRARRRERPTRETAAVESPASSGSLWRGLARTALAGPAAGAAALALAVMVARRAPWSEADRLVAAGFLLPCAWAAAGVWATTDTRLGRVGAGLVVLTVAGFGGAVL